MNRYENTKQQVFEILNSTGNWKKSGQFFNYFLIAVIIVDISALIAGTVDWIGIRWGREISSINRFAVSLYLVEYLLRVWTCTRDSRYSSPLKGRIAFILTPMMIIDLLAVVPLVIFCFTVVHIKILQLVRLGRLFQILKITRYNKSIQLFTKAMSLCKNQLILTGFLVVAILVILSGIVYFVEYPVQPAKFSDMPETIYWAALTMTTVGYGDMVPVTPVGKFGAMLISISGIIAFALITGILSSAFFEEYEEMHKTECAGLICPYCGKSIK